MTTKKGPPLNPQISVRAPLARVTCAHSETSGDIYVPTPILPSFVAEQRLIGKGTGRLSISVLLLCWLGAQVACQTSAQAQVQIPTPNPPPSAGLLNDWLRQQSPGFEPWDIGGQVRGRFE